MYKQITSLALIIAAVFTFTACQTDETAEPIPQGSYSADPMTEQAMDSKDVLQAQNEPAQLTTQEPTTTDAEEEFDETFIELTPKR